MSESIVVDKHGRKGLYPASDSTVDRQMKQEKNPFPAGAIIGGKRYWRRRDILDWLARQFGDDAENGGHEPPATRGDAEVAETRDAGAA